MHLTKKEVALVQSTLNDVTGDSMSLLEVNFILLHLTLFRFWLGICKQMKQ